MGNPCWDDQTTIAIIKQGWENLTQKKFNESMPDKRIDDVLDTYERQNDWMVVRRAGLLFGSSPLHGFIVLYIHIVQYGHKGLGSVQIFARIWKFYQLHPEEGLSS